MSFQTALRAPASTAWDRPPTADKPQRPAFGGNDRPPRRSGGVAVLVAILLSMWLHATIFTSVVVWNWMHKVPPHEAPGPEIEMVDLAQNPALKLKLDQIRKIARIEEARGFAPVPTPPPDVAPGKQLVELAKPASPQDAPANAKYLAAENHKVAEETVSRDQVMAPKVLADSFKGMGSAAEKGESKFEGSEKKTGESAGHEEKTEHAANGRTDGAEPRATPPPERTAVADPFGIRVKPHEETLVADAGPRGTGADHDADTMAEGGGTKVAMGGAPSNDYLPNVRQGEKTQLNAKEFMFASFWFRVQRQVEPFWVKRINQVVVADLQKRDYGTRVNVTLSPDGNVVAVDIGHSCGIAGWDRAVVTAFNEAGPFPNPPKALVERDGFIHMDDLGFIVSLTGGTVVHMYGDPRSGNLFPGVHEGMNTLR